MRDTGSTGFSTAGEGASPSVRGRPRPRGGWSRRWTDVLGSRGGRVLATVGALAALLLASSAGCAGTPRQFSGEIVWEVNDRHPVPRPEERWAPKFWDAADHILFRPLSHLWLLRTAEPAANANAVGQVPNSSWYTNRLSRWTLSPRRVARGPCEQMEMPRGEKWVIRGGKIGGANPGFIIEVHHEDGSTRNYLLKFDNENQTERPTAADVIGSKIYWAAGFEVPCNRVVYFDRSLLELADDATTKGDLGREAPMTEADIERAIKYTPRLEDGRIRATSSKFLPGEPLGPFNYRGVRHDDRNDAIPHEERRELRGSRLVAAWLNHFDARQQNTYTSFIRNGAETSCPPEDETCEGEELGYVQHFMLDFGDCFGSVWPSDAMSRRFGHSWYVDLPDIFSDLFTLGAVPRPWLQVRKYEQFSIFGYYDIEHFDPEAWKAGYPNPAFRRMDLRDAFWATNIISKFSDAHIERLVRAAKFTKPRYSRYLERVMAGRRDKIVETYFRKLSPLVEPEVASGTGDDGPRLCVEDAWVARGYGPADGGFYDRRVSRSRRPRDERGGWKDVEGGSRADGRICVDVPPPGDLDDRVAGEGDLVVEMRVRRVDQRDPARPAAFYLRPEGDSYRIVGIIRVGASP